MVIDWLVHSVSQTLIAASEPTWEQQRMFLLDGTTMTLAPDSPELHQAFPPPVNQYGAAPDPIASMVVAHELESGVALLPEVGPYAGSEALYLVTNLEMLDAEALAELYSFRWDVEVDLCNLKVVLDTENIQAKSVETFHQELVASVVAYNLTSQFRRLAAGQAKVRRVG